MFNRKTEQPALSPELKAALAKLAEADRNRKKVDDALAAAVDESWRLKASLGTSRTAIANNEIEAALAGANKSDNSKARKAILELRNEIELSEEKITGLRARLATADDGIARAREAVRTAYADWQRQQIEAEMDKLETAANAFRTALCRGSAVALALGHSRLAVNVRSASFTSPKTNKPLLADIRNSWKNDPTAISLYDALMTIREQVNAGIADDLAIDGADVEAVAAAH